MKIVIDARERDLISIMPPDTIKKNLDLGDIIIYNEPEGNIAAVIERKTVKDFASSIKDGRYKEQKARLIDCYVKKGIFVMYIIEDFKWSPETKINGIPYTTLMNSIITTMIRDNIYVYKSNNLNETKDFILALLTKSQVLQIPIKEEASPSQDYLENSLKLKKKDNKKESDSMIFILCQVPRVSVKIAQGIRTLYPSIKDLILAFLESEEKELMLSSIKVNNRRLGKNVSENIWKYLC